MVVLPPRFTPHRKATNIVDSQVEQVNAEAYGSGSMGNITFGRDITHIKSVVPTVGPASVGIQGEPPGNEILQAAANAGGESPALGI